MTRALICAAVEMRAIRYSPAAAAQLLYNNHRFVYQAFVEKSLNAGCSRLDSFAANCAAAGRHFSFPAEGSCPIFLGLSVRRRVQFHREAAARNDESQQLDGTCRVCFLPNSAAGRGCITVCVRRSLESLSFLPWNSYGATWNSAIAN